MQRACMLATRRPFACHSASSIQPAVAARFGSWGGRQPITAISEGAMRPRRVNGAVKMTPLDGLIGYALRRAQLAIFADLNQALAPRNFRPGQFAVLTLIDQNPGPSQSSVSEALGIQKANFVATITELANRGLVRRRKSESDGRTYSLGLTPRGRTLLEDAVKLQ